MACNPSAPVEAASEVRRVGAAGRAASCSSWGGACPPFQARSCSSCLVWRLDVAPRTVVAAAAAVAVVAEEEAAVGCSAGTGVAAGCFSAWQEARKRCC